MPTYVPRFDGQRDPDDPYRNVACAAASSSMAIDRATIGGLVAGQRLIRALSGEPVPDPDSPGLTVAQCVAASRKLHVPLVRPATRSWGLLHRELDRGRGAILAIRYGALPRSYRFDPDYQRGHMLYVNAHGVRADGYEWLRYADPLADGWRTGGDGILRRAALAYADPPDYALTRATPLLA